jgi:hypothetical protein
MITTYNDVSSGYDQYRINWVQLKFVPKSRMNSTILSNTNSFNDHTPMLFMAVDKDAGAAVNSQDDIMDYANYRVLRPMDTTIIRFRPTVAMEAYRGVTSTGYAYKSGVWVSLATADLPHYGMQFFFGNPYTTATNPTPLWDVYLTINFSLKELK